MNSIKLLIWSTIFVFFLFINGCKNESDYNSVYNSSLEELVKYFPDTLLKHFPENINTQFQINTTYPVSCNQNNRCGVTLLVNYDEDFLKRVEEDLTSISIVNLKYSDNCNLIVDAKHSKVDCNNYLDTILRNCNIFSPPIPNFPKILNENKTLIKTDSIDINKFQIYVLMAFPGVYIDKSNLSNGWCLPEEWKNGFSKGIALNTEDNQVIYWLEIW